MIRVEVDGVMSFRTFAAFAVAGSFLTAGSQAGKKAGAESGATQFEYR